MLVQVIRFLFVIVGAVAGYELTKVIQAPHGITGIILFIIIGCGVGYVIGSLVGKRLDRVMNWLESAVQKMPGFDLFISVLGLVIGLFIALLVSIPFGSISNSLVRLFLTIFTFVILGFLGLRVSLYKKDDFRSLFHFFGSGKKPLIASSVQNHCDKILDTSVIIDGRIADVCKTGFIEGHLNVPRFVLGELQGIADSEDPLKRNRGRRGLDVLRILQREPKIEVVISDSDYPDIADVDAKLVQFAKETGGVVLTNDYNLNKVAELQGVRVLNINELANAIKPVVLPGEEMQVLVLREGKEIGQGVGYLDDGTMIVIDGGKNYLGREIDVMVTSVLQTPAGKMIFTKPKDLEANSA